MKFNNIKAILFDSGRVLNYPRTGNWFISPRIFEFIDRDVFDRVKELDINKAFRKAYDYIEKQSLIIDREQEYYHFRRFYRIFSDELPILNLDDELVDMIAKDLVYNNRKYKFYDDVYEVIPKLYERYELGIVSDAWPSLLNVYEEAGLRDYFSKFIISSIIGLTKPDKGMFIPALEELGISPAQTLFIDDNYRNCQGAEELGINSIVLDRDKSYDQQVESISTLDELVKILD